MNTMTRRSFILTASHVLVSLPIILHAQNEDPKKLVGKEEWMATWMMQDPDTRTSDSPLHLGRFKDPIYFTLNNITWVPDPEQASKFREVEVPTGFVTDLASIPPIFYTELRPDGEYAYAAIIHDYLYWSQTRPREEADEIFKMVMVDYKIKQGVINTIYQAVRLLGADAWKANAQLKAQGEKRILKKYPPTGNITWAEWKRQHDVLI